ncbi:MAG: AGE family epimerase/isomerase [Chitinophagaceae bacterium]|nr:AGE family epimerase/isomerase [Chitinophagaceae bacterium]
MHAADTISLLPGYSQEVFAEMESILAYWMSHTVDDKNGGFYGFVNDENIPATNAEKGVVLNSRILWTFSAAYRLTGRKDYSEMATRAYKYISDHFIDQEHGGVYWSVTSSGKISDPKKQVYGQAFCLYGLSEYFNATRDQSALDLAKGVFEKIERHGFDGDNGGYHEAFTREWKSKDDLRLSDKDDNEKKSANTNLHVIEAYANLFAAWPDIRVADKIKHILDVFEDHIIDRRSGHLHLFMDEHWTVRSRLISFGHDIEASWLLLDCANRTGDSGYIRRFTENCIRLADAAARAVDIDGGLFYEYDGANDEWSKEKHWWPQAEAMLGFFNAWQVSGDEKYLYYSVNSWEFIKTHIRDAHDGEWYWGIDPHKRKMLKGKAGFWKCPYHNVRACIELSGRIVNLKRKNQTSNK